MRLLLVALLFVIPAAPGFACGGTPGATAPPVKAARLADAANAGRKPGHIRVYSRCGGAVWMKRPT
jgi:hypothetical protein